MYESVKFQNLSGCSNLKSIIPSVTVDPITTVCRITDGSANAALTYGAIRTHARLLNCRQYLFLKLPKCLLIVLILKSGTFRALVPHLGKVFMKVWTGSQATLQAR